MNIIDRLLNTILLKDNEQTKIGLSQFKTVVKPSEPTGPSLRKKDVKLSDLMRRVS